VSTAAVEAKRVLPSGEYEQSKAFQREPADGATVTFVAEAKRYN